MELKELLVYLGLDAEKVKTLDEFKSVFDKEFIRPSAFKETESYKSLTGELLGAAMGKIKNAFKDLDITLSADEIKDKNYHEVLAIGMGKLKETHKTKIAELEGKQGQGVEDAKKEWESKYNSLNSKFTDTQKLLETTSQDFEKHKTDFSTKIKTININNYKKSVIDKYPLITTAPKLQVKGFHDTLNENYQFDFDEDGETPIIKNAKGERIRSESTTGKFKTFEEVYQEEANKENLLQKTKPQAQTSTIFTAPASNQPPPRKEVYVHPNAL